MTSFPPAVANARDELIDRAEAAEDVQDVFSTASERLRRLVPFDSCVWLATDPGTTLPTAPTRSENMERICSGDGKSCLRVWELEFLVEDVNLYTQLARAETPASGLRQATDDRPARSARYREYLRPNGLDDELRAVMRVDGQPWVSVGLFREEGRPAFATDEIELVASLSDSIAAAVRDHARAAVWADADEDDRGPGLMVFSPDGELVSANDDAHAWLEQVPADAVERNGFFGARLPMLVCSTLMRARAVAEERDHGPARARMRSVSGRWLVCHASCLRDSEGNLGNTALVIEPAKTAEIAPIIVQAYELSKREQEIAQLISRGLGTAEIADRLYLSPHTVRDYVKAIFEKVGVSSRGELVAKVFAEHYAPVHLDPGAHVLVSN